LPALNRARVKVVWTDITIRHTGYVDLAVRARKLDRDIRILKAELEDRPDDPFILFNLGQIAVDRGEWSAALGYLERSVARSAPSDSITRKLYALIARAHQMMGNAEAAVQTCAKGLAADPEDAELWFRKGVVHRLHCEPAKAEDCWRRILTLRRPDQFCSFDQAIYGHRTGRNLADLATRHGDHAEAARLWHAVLRECPGDPAAQSKLASLRARNGWPGAKPVPIE
jgi:tetratricopeptide (TPR) repeat protein